MNQRLTWWQVIHGQVELSLRACLLGTGARSGLGALRRLARLPRMRPMESEWANDASGSAGSNSGAWDANSGVSVFRLCLLCCHLPQ